MEPILDVRDLTKTFEGRGRRAFTAVDRVNLRLCPGEILGVVGESGSGKTTLAKLVTRLLEPSGGTILLDGRDITHAGGARLRGAYGVIQMVFQDPAASFNPRRTLGDGIGESLKNRGVPAGALRERVARLLEQCGLDASFAGRYPHEVSGGQCQRAAIARALAIEPKILICDEATSALDVTVQRQILDLLRGLQRERGLAYLFICHNLALVQSFCDRVAVLRDGAIVEEGTPDEVILSPKSEYARRLADAVL